MQPQPSLLAAGPLNPGGPFDFLLKGEPGGTYQIEVSTNLLNWTPISTNTLNTGTLMFHDPRTPVVKQRFYRALRKL